MHKLETCALSFYASCIMHYQRSQVVPNTATAALNQPHFINRLRRVDFFLLGCVGLIIVIGMCFIASAVRGLPDGGGSAGFLARQTIFICMGMTIFYALQRVSYL